MSAFNTDLETLLPDLTRFARVLTRNEDDAHDLVQDCVERALSKQDLFQAGTSLKSWLFTLMRNIFISQRRRAALDKRYVASLGGSLSAEHGIGIAKTRWLELTRTPEDIATMRAIKAAFDPSNILNPGVIFA